MAVMRCGGFCSFGDGRKCKYGNDSFFFVFFGGGLKCGGEGRGGGGGGRQEEEERGGDGTGCSSIISPFTLRVGLITAACGWARTACS